MALYGTQFTAIYNAWNTSINSGVVGDAANHSLFWVKDGTASATTNSAAEVDGSNIPGLYKVVITGEEASCILGALGGKSSTPHVSIIPIIVPFEKLPNALPGTYGGLPTTDSNNHIHGISGTLNQLDDLNNFDPTNDTVVNVSNITSLGSSGNLAQTIWEYSERVLTADDNINIPSSGTIAQTVWEYSARTLTADDNINIPSSGDIASTVWNYATRTLTSNNNLNISSSGDIAGAVWDYTNRTLTANDNIDFPTSGDIASTVWEYATRTITSDDNINYPSSGTIAQTVWEYGTRILTGGDNIEVTVDSGVIAQTVWEYSARTLTSDDNINIPSSGDIASTVWGYLTRTLTSGAAASSGDIASAVWYNPTRTLTSLTEDILDVNVISVNGIPQTNVIISGTVLDIGFVPTRSEFETGDINTAAADHYNGRIIVFTTGTLAGQACTIQDYSLEGLYGHFTVSQLTSAPTNGDTFAIY